MTELNCPSCGAGINPQIKYSKLVVCPYCRTAIFLEDGAARQAGTMSVLTDQPSVLNIGESFRYNNLVFVPVGHVRYKYSRGSWDEWWVVADNGDNFWLSFDEGDVAVENSLELPAAVPPFSDVQIGQEIPFGKDIARVTEKDCCQCSGAEGELPFFVSQDEKYDYIDLSGDDGLLFTLEYTEDGIECFKGKWIDIFEIKKV